MDDVDIRDGLDLPEWVVALSILTAPLKYRRILIHALEIGDNAAYQVLMDPLQRRGRTVNDQRASGSGSESSYHVSNNTSGVPIPTHSYSLPDVEKKQPCGWPIQSQGSWFKAVGWPE